MAEFINRKDEYFNGCLMVMNIGNDNYESLPKEFIEKISERVREAHADGWMVLYVFDDVTDPSKAPDYFDSQEEMDFVRMMWGVCGRRDAVFALSPTQRLKEFNDISGHVIEAFEELRSENFAVCGMCSIETQKVLLPPFTLP